MTAEEFKSLKAGDRVKWTGADPAEGVVVKKEHGTAWVKWDDLEKQKTYSARSREDRKALVFLALA